MNNINQSFDNSLSTMMEDVIVNGVEIGDEEAPEVNPHLAGPFCYFTKPELHWLELYFLAGSFPLLSRKDGVNHGCRRVSDLLRELNISYRADLPQARDLCYDKTLKRFIITTNIATGLTPERFRFVILPKETTTLELGVHSKRLNVTSYVCAKDKVPINITAQDVWFKSDRFILGCILLLIESIQNSSDSHLRENTAITLTTLDGGRLGLASDSGQRRYFSQEKWRQIGLLLENIFWKYGQAYSRHLGEATHPSRPIKA